MIPIDHPLRRQMTNELHARPFPVVDAPCQIAYLAIQSNGEEEDQLRAFLTALGCDDPGIINGHYTAQSGNVTVRWERHTEFVTYSVFVNSKKEKLFSDGAWGAFPEEWLAKIEAPILTSIKVDVLAPMAKRTAEKEVSANLQTAFATESLAISYVLDEDAIIASDFLQDEQGFIRFALVPIGSVGRQRLGRISQRLVEIETYRALTMLTLPIAREVFGRVNVLDKKLAQVVSGISKRGQGYETSLNALMSISTEIEFLNAEHEYRFGAGEAYAALVDQRIFVLREQRFLGRQTFGEFMMRRFSPSVRTCVAAKQRLKNISDRAARATSLLGTRVNVRTAEQNRALLEQMDKRAALQLRLQETVEGLSVVAISYYGVNLATSLLAPIAYGAGIDAKWLKAALVIPIVGLVWFAIRRIKRQIDH